MARSVRAGCVGILILACVWATGCRRTSGLPKAPAACTGGHASVRIGAFRAALARAPGPVRLRDGTSISDCLARDADSGDLQEVGSMLLRLTQQIEDSARGPGDRRALVELGYLAGAVHRGAAKAQGVDGEIERRIDQELISVDTASPDFKRGERAGRATG